MKYFAILAFAFILAGSLATPAFATQQTSYEWAGNFKEYSPNGLVYLTTDTAQSSQWFPTGAACQANLTAWMADDGSEHTQVQNGPLTCSCSEAIYLQSSCPDYAAANTANDSSGGIPQGGACQQGNSDQCASNLICGNSNTCIPGNLPDGSACTEDDQCVSQNGCSSSGICSSSTNNGNITNTNNPNTSNNGNITNVNPTSSTGSSVSLLNPLSSGTSLPGLLSEVLGFVTQIGTVIIVLMVVYVGFKFVMAQGDPGALAEARQALLWTVVGALILLGANAIALAIQATASAL